MVYSEKGSLLIAVIIAIVVVSALGAGIATMVTTGVRSSTDHSLSIQALYLAESGFEWARAHLQGSTNFEVDCIALQNNPSLPVDLYNQRHFDVKSSINGSGNCTISSVGWIGSNDKSNSLSSRRLIGTILKSDINTNSTPIDFSNDTQKNIFADENTWEGTQSHTDFRDDGSIVFSQNSQKDQLNRSKSKNISQLIPEDRENIFDENDTIYLVMYLDSSDLGKLSDFGLNKLPPSNNNFDWTNNDINSFGSYKSVYINLGSGYTAEDINEQPNLSFFIEWSQNSITVRFACIGKISTCQIEYNNDISHNPVNDVTWIEE